MARTLQEGGIEQPEQGDPPDDTDYALPKSAYTGEVFDQAAHDAEDHEGLDGVPAAEAFTATAHDSHAHAGVSGVLGAGIAVTDLNLTVADPPTQVQVQAVADKLDDLLDSLRTAGHIAT